MGLVENKTVQIAFTCLIPFIGAWYFGYGSETNSSWYENLKRPIWGPSDWIYGPVWAFLYSSMGYASHRVEQAGCGFSGAAKIPLILYTIKLLINWTWFPVFFNFHLLGAATIHAIILLALVIATGITFFRVDKTAGIIFIPYMAWVSFASILNYTTWRLNS